MPRTKAVLEQVKGCAASETSRLERLLLLGDARLQQYKSAWIGMRACRPIMSASAVAQLLIGK